MVKNLGEIVNLELTMDNAPGRLKQREILLHVLVLEELVHLVACDDALSGLAVKKLLLNVLDGLTRTALLSKRSADLEVSATSAGGDEIGHTGRLDCKSVNIGFGEESLGEVDHLQHASSHNGGLGVISPVLALDETGAKSNNVLESSSDGNSGNVLDTSHVEVGSVEQSLENLVGHIALAKEVLGSVVSHGGLGVLLQSNLGGEVGSRENSTVQTGEVLDDVRKKVDSLRGHVQTLEAGDCSSLGVDVALELLADTGQELMGQVEDDDVGALDGLEKVWLGDQVVRKFDFGQVSHVFVLGVENVGQVLAVDLFFSDPDLDLIVEELGVSSAVFGDDFSNSSSPELVNGREWP